MANGLEKHEFHSHAGKGSFQVLTWGKRGLPNGGPLVLLGPGWGDESGRTRVPAAKELAKRNIRAAVVRHTGRTGLQTILHPRRQRSMDIEAAIELMETEYRPDFIVAVGHSYGGPNSNDAARHRIQRQGGRNGATGTPIIVVHEAAPGLGEKPFVQDEANVRKEVTDMAHHLGAMGILLAHELRPDHVGQRIVGTVTMINEMRSLMGIHIQPGADYLTESGVSVHNLYYDEDGLVQIPNDMRGATNTTLLPGGHLASYFDSNLLPDYLEQNVLPGAA